MLGNNASTVTSVAGKQSGATHHDGVADDEAMAIEDIREKVVVKQNRIRSVNGSVDEHVYVDVGGNTASTTTPVSEKQSGATHNDGVAGDESMAIELNEERADVKLSCMQTLHGSVDQSPALAGVLRTSTLRNTAETNVTREIGRAHV